MHIRQQSFIPFEETEGHCVSLGHLGIDHIAGGCSMLR